MTPRQALGLVAALTCAAATTLAGLVAAVLTPADDPRDEDVIEP